MHLSKLTRFIIWIAVAFVIGLFGCADQSPTAQSPTAKTPTALVVEKEALTPGRIETAFRKQKGNLMVADRAWVTKILPDDTKGTRHQRFIVKLESGQRLLIAHNIDLAPRVAGIQPGDSVVFRGEYEWNHKGGVIHWTHHDPRKRHPGGWIKHGGRKYE